MPTIGRTQSDGQPRTSLVKQLAFLGRSISTRHTCRRTLRSISRTSRIKRVSEIVEKQSVEALRDYLYVRTLSDLTYLLGRPLRQALFELQIRAVGHEKRQGSMAVLRSHRKVHTTGCARLRIRQAVPFRQTDPAVLQVIKDIYDAWEDRLGDVPWLDDSTRKAALEKLRNISYHVGYPDKTSFEPKVFDRKAFATNVFRADRARHTKGFLRDRRAGRPGRVDEEPAGGERVSRSRTQQHLRPHGDAHAADLQSPGLIPVQFGTLGMTIGHEPLDMVSITTDRTSTPMKSSATGGPIKRRRSSRSVSNASWTEFSTFSIFPDLKVNGKLSVGENIADIAGLRMAFRAYQKHQKTAKERIVAGGFSEDQQFFLSRAQSWCTLISEEGARSSSANNPHIYPKWAVNGPLHHLTEFYQAFDCKVPDDICTMW